MSFKDIDAAAESDPLIRKRRLLRYNGYEYANDAEANAQSVSTSAQGA